MLGRFAFEESFKQVQGSAYETDPKSPSLAVEDHGFHRHADTHRLLQMDSELLIDGVDQADIIDDASNDAMVIKVE